MGRSQDAEPFLAESREYLSIISQRLLARERDPLAGEPVAEPLRSARTLEGMGTMGGGAVAGLAGGERYALRLTASVTALWMGRRGTGLVADRLAARQTTEVKPIPALRGTPPVFGGATMSSGGRPVLMLGADGFAWEDAWTICTA